MIVWGMIEGYDSPFVIQVNEEDEWEARSIWAEHFDTSKDDSAATFVFDEKNFLHCAKRIKPKLKLREINELMNGA